MKLWMDVMRDLESVMNDHERILDAWAEGGVDGVVFGPLVFGTAKLSKDAVSAPTGDLVAEAYDPNPAVYARLGVEPPAPPQQKLPEKRVLLEKTMNAAKDRGMQVYCMYADGGAGPGGQGHHLHDDKTLASRVARMVDTLEHFPMADGAVMDGPEWGYEIAPHHMNHRSYFFHDLPESVAPMAADLGYDYEAMVAAKDRLLSLFHNLDPVRIRGHAPRRPSRSLPHARSRSRSDGLAVVPGRLADSLFSPHPRRRRRRARTSGTPRMRPALGRLRSPVWI